MLRNAIFHVTLQQNTKDLKLDGKYFTVLDLYILFKFNQVMAH